MKVEIQTKVVVGEAVLDVATLLSHLDTHREALSDISAVSGTIIVRVDGEEYGAEQNDPIVRLVDQWVRKVPWVLGGDTEAVAFRNSEHCYAFVPAGDSVELSYFAGSETEVEDYILEPVTLRLEQYIKDSLRMSEALLEVAVRLDPGLTNANEDCRDLKNSIDEAKKAWREHQLHNRR